MRIAVASGKGGTGKTTLATSLALSLATPAPDHPAPVPPLFLDCDVEAPNAHLFLQPTFERRQEVGLLVPEVDADKCSGCGRCAEVCQYHAIVVMGKKTLVFSQLCHGCGSCTLNCPESAIHETLDVMGVLEAGPAAAGISFARGLLNVGEPMAVPVIRQLKRWAQPAAEQAHTPDLVNSSASVGRPADGLRGNETWPAGQDIIYDAPPGTSCPVVESVRGADFLLLVTEPTPFGLHDLRLAAEVARELGIPAGVVINRDGIGDRAVDEFCAAAGMPVLMRIPFEQAIAEGVARGRTLVDIHPGYAARLRTVYREMAALVSAPVAPDGENRGGVVR